MTLENNTALRFDSGGTLRVQGSQSIEGEGQILFGGTSGGRIDILVPAPHTLTIGEGVVVRTDVNGGSILDKPPIAWSSTGKLPSRTACPCRSIQSATSVANSR